MKYFLRPVAFCLGLTAFFFLAQPGRLAGADTNSLPAVAPTPPPAPPAALTNMQEELRLTQQILEQLRRDLDQSAARNAAAITTSLSVLEPTLTRLQAQQMQLVQRSNSTILIVAGVFAGVGFVA